MVESLGVKGLSKGPIGVSFRFPPLRECYEDSEPDAAGANIEA